jgi:hypothetical protein
MVLFTMDMTTNLLRVTNNMVYHMKFSREIAALVTLIRLSLSDSKNSLPDCWYCEYTAAQFRGT